MKDDIVTIEWFAFISMLLGLAVFCIACSWDNLIGITMHHNKGYGWFQILVIATSGVYTGVALAINRLLHNYVKKIRGFNEPSKS